MRPKSRHGESFWIQSNSEHHGVYGPNLCPETQPRFFIPLSLPVLCLLLPPSSLSLSSFLVISVPWKLQLISAALGLSHPNRPSIRSLSLFSISFSECYLPSPGQISDWPGASQGSI